MKYIAIINTDEPLTENTIQLIKDTIFCGDEQAPYVFEIEDILHEAESEGEFSDYPDMPNQFDNMTGSMNL